jgi:rhamnosyltransferase
MNIVGIVITFEPDIEGIRKLFDALIPQVNKIVVIDNFSSISPKEYVVSRYVEYIQLTENFGIAYAQNIGIQWAVDFGATHVLLLDQDSVPDHNMVSMLSSVLIENQVKMAGAAAIAAVGPSYKDIRSNKRSFYVIEKNHLPSRWIPDDTCLDSEQVEAVFLISSGTLIPIDVIKALGGMRSDYFIDHVDTEWSFRAKQLGYRIVGVPSAVMEHSLGDEVKSIWFFGKRQVSYHSPLRDYYMFRNTLLMLRDVSMSTAWRLHFVWRLVQFAVYFLVFSSSRLERLSKMGLGLYHGLRNVRGKLDLVDSSCRVIPATLIDPK